MGEAAAVIEDKTTEEEVNWMNDDGKTGGEEGEGDEEGTEGVDDAGKEGQGGEEGKEDKGKAGKTEEGKTEEEKVYSPEEEIRDLRSLLRNSKRQMFVMDAQLKRVNAKSDAALLATVEEDEDGVKAKLPEDKLSEIEVLQMQLDKIGQERGPILDVLAETMEQNAKYSDLKEVCSRANFDDVFDTIASEMAKDGKGNKEELLLKVEVDVWAMSNPYKYMYEFIKANSPKYAENKDKKNDKADGSKQTMKSLAGTGGGSGTTKSGWTSAKIDALSEEELDKVPADVYTKYIDGDLD